MTTGIPQRFSAATLKMLREAGWFPGRDVATDLKLPDGFAINPLALQVLQEFAYLRVGQSGPGIERAQRTIDFDPMLAWGEDDRFRAYEDLLGRFLYPLGEVDGGYYFLAIDQTGGIFLVMDHCWFVDTTFDHALDRLLVGKSLRLVNDQGRW